MTSVCQIKSRLSHDVLMTKTLSSLSIYPDEDSGSEKATDSDKTVQNDTSEKSDADSSEFSIANILGFQEKKSASVQFDGSKKFSKWRLHNVSPPGDKRSDFCNVSHCNSKDSMTEKTCVSNSTLVYGQKVVSNNPSSTSHFDGDHDQEERQDEEENDLYLSSHLEMDGLKDDNETSEFRKRKKTDSNESDSKDDTAPSSWATALNNYYESLNPTWKMWQDLIIRRSIPLAPSNRQHPGFHPYMRRFPGLVGSSSSLYGSLPPLPINIDSSKSKYSFSVQRGSSENSKKANDSK